MLWVKKFTLFFLIGNLMPLGCVECGFSCILCGKIVEQHCKRVYFSHNLLSLIKIELIHKKKNWYETYLPYLRLRRCTYSRGPVHLHLSLLLSGHLISAKLLPFFLPWVRSADYLIKLLRILHHSKGTGKRIVILIFVTLSSQIINELPLFQLLFPMHRR